MRMATGWPSTFSCAGVEICCCICAAAFKAASALGKVAMTSSPMVLMTVPWSCSVALRITSMQIATMSRARRSPIVSYSRVDPTTSANRMASSISLPMSAARLYASAFAPLARVLGPRAGRNRPSQQLRTPSGGPRTLTQRAPVVARPGLAAVQAEHVARNCGEAPAGGKLALGVTLHASGERLARGCGAGTRMQRPLQFGEQVRPVVGLAPEHDAVAPAERLDHRARLAQTPVDHDRQ